MGRKKCLTKFNSKSETLYSLVSRDSYCNFCLKYLSSKYGLKMHLFKVHHVKNNNDDDDELDDEESKKQFQIKTKLKTKLKTSEPYRSNIKTKLQTEVKTEVKTDELDVVKTSNESMTCFLCGKEMCSKYYLKYHLIKSHKITMTDLDVKQEPLEYEEYTEPTDSNTDSEYFTSSSANTSTSTKCTDFVENESKIKIQRFWTKTNSCSVF